MTPQEFIAKWRASPKDERSPLAEPLHRPLPPARHRRPGHRRPDRTTGSPSRRAPPRPPAARAGPTSGARAASAGNTRASAARTSTRLSTSSSTTPARWRTRRSSSSPTWTASSSAPTGPTPSRRPTPSPSTTCSTAPSATSSSAAFTDPERLKPQKTRDALTAEAAAQFSALAQRLRERGHDARDRRPLRQPPRLLHVRRGRRPAPRPALPEDAGSLPPRPRRLRRPRRHPLRRHAAPAARRLHPGRLVQRRPLRRRHRPAASTAPTSTDLLEAARLDWSQIDPSILGTLFERGLDPGQAQPARRPLHRPRQDHEDRQPGHRRAAPRRMGRRAREIEAALAREKAADIPAAATRAHNARRSSSRTAFLERLEAFRVLDPACGSGNFLYLALRALKDIEHRVNVECEALGLPRSFPAGRPRGRPRHRAQPLRRRARPRLGLDRRDPVDARQRLRRLAATRSSARSTPSSAATPS